MAESVCNWTSDDLKSSIPTNEEMIDSLTSDLKEHLITDEPDSPSKSSSTINNTTENSRVGSVVGSPNVADSENILSTNSCEEDTAIKNQEIPSSEDDSIDELMLKDRELTYSEEEKINFRKEAEDLKLSGNEQFKSGQYRESALCYTQALRVCPLAYEKDRAVLYANRAAAKMKLGMNESAIEDCTKSLELDERYLKTLYRRAQLYETTEKLDEALNDYAKILEIDPHHQEARSAAARLPGQIQERNEKLKAEMMGKLRDLGNMFLKPFGLSTDNFQLNQDPNSSGYSINFKS